jgi:AbiV family abortive infection protein
MKTEKGKKDVLDLKGDMRVAMRLFGLYDACLKNATALLSEADLLFKNGHYARAFALAHTGWEETGKSQIVADFLNQMVSEEEFEAAFKDHKLKSAYNWRRFVLNPANLADSTIEYDRSKAAAALQKRHSSLYVEKQNDCSPIAPENQVSKEGAHAVIEALRKELNNIRFYDAVNERVGSQSFLK